MNSTPNPMHLIEQRAKALADVRTQLGEVCTEINDGIEAIKRSKMRSLKALTGKLAEYHHQLNCLIQEHPELFKTPRTVVLHGLKLGYQKGKGKIDIEDPDLIIARIKKHLPGSVDDLIKTTEKLSKSALNDLDGAELKKIGISVSDTGDQIVIKPVDGAVDKLLKALVASVMGDEPSEDDES